MDGFEVLIDPHNEVKKLQELVKKLEKQNEVLRSKTPAMVSTNENGDIDSNSNGLIDSMHMNGKVHEKDNEKTEIHLADLDDVDYLNLPSDEGGWLYQPLPETTSDETEESLVSWIRQDFDHPTPERESLKRNLVHFIEEASRMKHSSSNPMLGNHLLPGKSPSALTKSTDDSRLMGPPATPTSRLASLKKGAFDSGTFTRPKRLGNPALKVPFQGEGDQIHNVPNAADIENLAKQQEESLRQSITPSKNTLKKHQLVDGDNGARTSPSRFDLECSYMSQHRGSFSSDQSTPPESPHSNQQFQLNSDGGRQQRAIPSAPGLHYRSHNSSDSSLERHSVDTNGSDDAILAPESMRAPASRLQAPRSNSASNSGLPKRGYQSGIAPGLVKPQQQQGVSPNRQSGLPMAKRQIARPASSKPRSSLPQFRRPLAPQARPVTGQSQESEASWRDGCF